MENKNNVDLYESVDELISSQQNKVVELTQYINLIHDRQYLREDINKAINTAKNCNKNIQEIKVQTELAKQNIQMIKEYCKQAKLLEMKLNHIQNNIPNKFNKIPDDFAVIHNDKENHILCEQQEDNSLTPLPIRRHLDFVESTTPAVVKGKAYVHKEIQYLTQSEFSSIPSYMRGRVTYDTVNNFIDKLNKCISDKYTLMHTAKSAIKRRADLDKLGVYKRQECPKTQGRRFITQDDLKSAMGGKIDKHTLNMIPMLRHTVRIQEVRDGGIVRYIALTDGPH